MKQLLKLSTALTGKVSVTIPGKSIQVPSWELKKTLADGTTLTVVVPPTTVETTSYTVDQDYTIPVGTEVEVDVPDVSAPPPVTREALSPQVYSGVNSLVLEHKVVTGGAGLKFVNCNGLVLKDIEVTKSSFSGIWLDNCKNVVVDGCVLHHNGREQTSAGNSGRLGHGLFISGANSSNIKVTNVEAYGNFEDGCQQDPSLTTTVTYEDCDFHDNMENGFDGKGGYAVMSGMLMENNGDGRGMEAIVLHQQFKGLVINDSTLSLKVGENGASGINTSAGYIRMENVQVNTSMCESIPVESSWSEITAYNCQFIGSKTKPLARSTGGAKMAFTSCSFGKSADGNSVWIVDNGTSIQAVDVKPGLSTNTLTVK